MINNDLRLGNDEFGTIEYPYYARLPRDANGVREAYIYGQDGKWWYKTFFPDEWGDEDIIDAIVEASLNRTPNSDTFIKIVTKKGKSVPVKGYFLNKTSNLITSGFPDFTP